MMPWRPSARVVVVVPSLLKGVKMAMATRRILKLRATVTAMVKKRERGRGATAAAAAVVVVVARGDMQAPAPVKASTLVDKGRPVATTMAPLGA